MSFKSFESSRSLTTPPRRRYNLPVMQAPTTLRSLCMCRPIPAGTEYREPM